MSRKIPTDLPGAPDAPPPAAAAPSVDELSTQIMTWIGLAMRLSKARPMTESLGMLNELGLTMPQIVALHVMAFEGSMTMTGLVERLGLSTSAVSHLLHRLVQMGLCERQDDPDDRRQRRVRLTPHGVEIVRRLLQSRISDTRGSIEPLSDDARRRLSEVLALIVDELKVQVRDQAPATAAGEPGCAGHDFHDVLHRLEGLGDDVAEAAAAYGDSVAEAASALGDRIADSAADLGDRVAESVAKKAAVVSERIVRNVNARVERARRNKQEKS